MKKNYITYKIIRPIKKHIIVNIFTKDFLKIYHFFKINFKRKFLGYPYVAMIEIGNYCNLRCPTCPTPSGKINRKKELMDSNNFKKIIDNIKESVHVISLYYTNEPLLHPDIFNIIEYAHKNHLYTEISTNATLLTKEKAEKLLKSGLDEIILDLDGASKESYEQFRVGASFEQVLNNITYFCQLKKTLKLRKPFIKLQTILTKFNQDEIENIRKISKELDVDSFSLGSFSLGEYAYSKEQIKKLSLKFFPDTLKYSNKIRYKKEGDLLKLKSSPIRCSMAKSHFVVLVDGRVSMCCYDINGKYIYGNVLDKKIKDIWFNQEIIKRRKIAEKRGYPLCNVCSIYK